MRHGFDSEDYATCFETWLASARSGMLLMCHPANARAPHDPIGGQRLVEYAFFDSERFPGLLAAHRVTLQRLSTVLKEVEETNRKGV